MNLSVCMIVRNEEQVLRRSLSAAKCFADELIVVDTGSEDRTKEIAAEYTGSVYDLPWKDSFCEARNFSFAKASGDYLMWLDADDLISDENVSRIRRLKEEGFGGVDVVYTIYRNHTQTGITDYVMRERMVRRSLHPLWEFDVHEAIAVDPGWKKTYRQDIEITHKKEAVGDPGRNLRILEKCIREGREFTAHEKVSLCMELVRAGRDEEACRLYADMAAFLHGKDAVNAIHFAGPAFYRTDRCAELYRLIEEAEKKDPPTAQLLFMKGLCLESAGDPEGAARCYGNAAFVPEDPMAMAIVHTGYRDYFPLLRLAGIAEKNGDRSGALWYLDKAGQNYPKEKGWLIMKLKLLMEEENQVTG